MAATKNTTATKETTAKNTTVAKETKKPKEYKVVGKKFKDKSEANKELKEVFKKGFKSAGLMVKGGEFAILFGTYTNEHTAKENAEVITGAGIEAQVVGE